MKILFVHQNFPAQYRWLAATLGTDKRWQVMALGDASNRKKRGRLPGVSVAGYPPPAPASSRTHHYVRPLEGAVRRGQAGYTAADNNDPMTHLLIVLKQLERKINSTGTGVLAKAIRQGPF